MKVKLFLMSWISACLISLISAHYTNEWAVQVHGGDKEADEVAREHDCHVVAKIFDDTYLLSHKHVAKRSTDPHDSVHQSIREHPHVKWTEQQKVLSRKKRQLWGFPRRPQTQNPIPDHYENEMHLNDQRFAQMWYLNRGSRLDMNVQEAWKEGVTGKGISITILDDGVERSHPDIVANYDPLASYDVNENDGDPTPRYDLVDSNRHGTRCAGEVSATANNSECAVGIAYDSGIGGVRMLDGDVTDAVEARSLGLNNQHIHIYSASWGPDDDGKTVDGPGKLASRAFLQGIAKGRGGKGSIFVWASGNGGRDHDNCNCDGYTNSIWTLSVSSATENGLIPWYSEACSSTLATTYSSGSAGERKVVTTDLHHLCTSSHTGTSASAPLAAGIIALCLQVNKELSWRDVQHLTVRCAHNANLRANDWSVNSLGRNFSHSFGYGLMDASCMVRLARVWKSVPEQKKCSAFSQRPDLIVPGRSISKSTIEVKDCTDVQFLEHVQAHVTLSASKRGDVLIFLVSPHGTRSNLVAKRPRDYSRAGFNDWPFLTVHMWEENPIGTWTLEIQNDGRSIVQLKTWSLALMGTKTSPNPGTPLPPPPSPSPKPVKVSNAERVPDQQPIGGNIPPNPIPGNSIPKQTPISSPSMSSATGPKSYLIDNCEQQKDVEWCDKCAHGFYLHVGRCIDKCPKVGFFSGKDNENGGLCVPCYYSCKTCSGPNDYECTSCYGDAELEKESFAQHYCHNKSLINKVFSSSRWYYVLSLGFLINFFIVVILIVYILRWRRSREQAPILPKRKTSNTRYSPVKMENGSIGRHHGNDVTRPFHDFDTSSDDEELLRKPYTDEK